MQANIMNTIPLSSRQEPGIIFFYRMGFDKMESAHGIMTKTVTFPPPPPEKLLENIQEKFFSGPPHPPLEVAPEGPPPPRTPEVQNSGPPNNSRSSELGTSPQPRQ